MEYESDTPTEHESDTPYPSLETSFIDELYTLKDYNTHISGQSKLTVQVLQPIAQFMNSLTNNLTPQLTKIPAARK